MKLLVTGGAGFIGSNFIRYVLGKYPKDTVANLDKLTYAGNLDNLQHIREISSWYFFAKGDICDAELVDVMVNGSFDAIVNFAAESHVDRSIQDAQAFLRTDVLGTHTLLEAARKHGVKRFLQVSTDEVYGDLEAGGHSRETDPLHPSSPYSASKAAADLMVMAYHRTHGLPTLIVRSTNNYGPYQYPEKVIPLFITNAIDDKPLPIYGDGRQVRDWLYVEDCCEAIDLVLRQGTPGEVYNVGANNDPEVENQDIADAILDGLGKPHSLKRAVADRPGHDRRYAVTTDKIRKLGWKPRVKFVPGLYKTLDWYCQNETWWRAITESEEYQKFYARQYR